MRTAAVLKGCTTTQPKTPPTPAVANLTARGTPSEDAIVRDNYKVDRDRRLCLLGIPSDLQAASRDS